MSRLMLYDLTREEAEMFRKVILIMKREEAKLTLMPSVKNVSERLRRRRRDE